MTFIDDMMVFLSSVSGNPLVYSIVFFTYAVLAAIILPIPVEFGLFMSPSINPALKAIILGAGKCVGSLLVFYIGVKVEDDIRKWSEIFPWYKNFVDKMGIFVAKYGYYALFIMLSIPLMLDTVPLYLFTLFNKDGKGMERNKFAIVNFFAGIIRASIVLIAYHYVGIQLAS